MVGWIWHGKVLYGRQGGIRHGGIKLGAVRQARVGKVGFGGVWHGKAGRVWRGWWGEVMFNLVGFGRSGEAR